MWDRRSSSAWGGVVQCERRRYLKRGTTHTHTHEHSWAAWYIVIVAQLKRTHLSCCTRITRPAAPSWYCDAFFLHFQRVRRIYFKCKLWQRQVHSARDPDFYTKKGGFSLLRGNTWTFSFGRTLYNIREIFLEERCLVYHHVDPALVLFHPAPLGKLLLDEGFITLTPSAQGIIYEIYLIIKQARGIGRWLHFGLVITSGPGVAFLSWASFLFYTTNI